MTPFSKFYEPFTKPLAFQSLKAAQRQTNFCFEHLFNLFYLRCEAIIVIKILLVNIRVIFMLTGH